MKKSVLIIFTFLFLFGCASTKTNKLYRNAYNDFQNNEFEKAESTITQILYIDKHYTDAYVLRSIINVANGKIELAYSDLQLANSINSKYYLVHYNLGNLHFSRQEYEKAIDEYSIAIRLKMTFPDSYLNRANSYMSLTRYDKAIKDYRMYSSISNNQKANIEKLLALLEKR